MMERNADKVSLLVDGELDGCDVPCVIQAMKSDEAARARWENYHLIRDALRGNLPRQIPVNLAARVSQALEHEPIHFTPRQQSSSPQPYRAPSRTRAALGFALAASLSAIAVFGVGVMELNTTSPAPAGIEVASLQPQQQAVAVSAVSMPPESPAPAVQLAAAAQEPAKPARKPTVNMMATATGGNAKARSAPRVSSVEMAANSPVSTDLYEYLVNYHRYAPGAADTQEMLSYVQLVGYGPGK
jgi:sigma-E factor negative regulatory protein RseA